MAYTRPGVYVTETLSQTLAPRPNTTAVAAFVGTAGRGPTTPTLIDSWMAYKSLFGDLDTAYDLGYAVYHYFANGGRIAYITRVADTNGTATAASSASVTYVPSTGASATRLFSVAAKSVGTWGNNLSVQLTTGRVTATASVVPTFNLSVLLNGTEVESWSELSPLTSDSRNVSTVINNYSSYITVYNPVTVTASSGLSYSTASAVTLASGSDGGTIDATDYATAVSQLDTIDGNLIINLPGVYENTSGATANVITNTLTYAATRGNAFVIIDPNPTITDAASIATYVTAQYPKSGYGAVYYPMLQMVDPAKNGPAAIRTTFPGGALAGLFVRTDAERGVAKTPAGYSSDLRNALGLTSPMTDNSISTLYEKNVNCIKSVTGAGVVVLGGRTLAVSRPDRYISSRRSLNFVKQAITDITKTAIFEPNGPQLWSGITARITSFLTTFWGQGGLKGSNVSSAFFVVCDSTNNTPATVDAGEVHVQVGLALQYPAEFIIINVSQWNGGSALTETF